MRRFGPGSEVAPDVVAVLGPTNTGKTHRAVEEMLRHPTGVIGLPLRLLAREVYDRVTARVGERAVALVTGEEKRSPPDPRFHVCTVEAMPVDRTVSFLAVDEVQLAASRHRGHVFTDRLLRARGTRKTVFMGADTVAPLLRRLVPEARIERYDRFSRLAHAGARRLAALPPRSAVIAFRVADVYELADRLRAQHGGAAVVLGALSPRTRNAQVAMYQAGEVQVIVATDAIGMGLNLDVDHVAFHALEKFDGSEHRPLSPPEVAQIAGRAGRYRRDGRFGTLSSIGPMPRDLVDAVESHRFEPIRQLRWRNPDLDFGSIDDLLASLDHAPAGPHLIKVPRADDHRALAALAQLDDVRGRVPDRRSLRQLWDVCCIPNFRNDLDSGHHQLLGRIFGQLAGRGELSSDWLRTRIARLDRVDGDIETLMDRIARIRTWNYVSFRGRWVPDAAGWQQRTRSIEDRLSDALHERLSQRFVDRTASVVLGSARSQAGIDVSPEGLVTAGGQAVGHLRGLRFLPSSSVAAAEAVRRAVLGLLGPAIDACVERCVRAEHEEFELDEQGQILWEQAPIARLEADHDAPKVRMVRLDLLGAGARQRIERRLIAWSRDLVAELFEPLHRPEAERLSPAGRGLVYLLRQSLGTVERRYARRQISDMTRGDRRLLGRLDVRIGTHYVYVSSLLDPRSVAVRAVLAGIQHGRRPLPAPPPPDARSLTLDDDAPGRVYSSMGYPRLGGRAVRVDRIEQTAAHLRGLERKGPFELPVEACAWLGCDATDLPAIVSDLGYRRRHDGLFVRRRRRRSGRRRR